MMSKETGIEGNLPTWPGASKCYSKAYHYMSTYGPDHDLIDALALGDEETTKGILLKHATHEYLRCAGIE
jgi:hypothetical protein